MNKHHHSCQQWAAGSHKLSSMHFHEKTVTFTTSDLHPSMGQVPSQMDRPAPLWAPFPHAKSQAPRAAMLQASAQPLHA